MYLNERKKYADKEKKQKYCFLSLSLNKEWGERKKKERGKERWKKEGKREREKE